MKYQILIISLLLFALSFFILTQNIDKPFIGIHDWNGARYGQIAKNYIRYGLVPTKLGQSEDAAKHDKPSNFFTHYPPLLPLLIASSYKFFGISDSSTRIIPVIATSFMVVFIFLLGTLLLNQKAGILAALLTLATPLVRYFGKMPVHEPLVLSFSILAFLAVAFILKRKEKAGFTLLFLSVILAQVTHWLGFLLIPPLTFLFWKFKLSKKPLFALWIISGILFSFHFIQTYLLTGAFLGGGLSEIFFYRLVQGVDYTVFEFLHRLYLWGSTLLTLTLIIASLLFGLKLAKERKFSQSDLFVIGLAIFGLPYPLIFTNVTFIHNYFVFYFLPFVAISAAVGLFWFLKSYRFATLFAIAILLLVYFERASFLEALENSRGDELAYKVGIELTTKTAPQDIILIKPQQFGMSRRPILAFYGERDMIFQENGALAYNWIVEVDETTNTFNIRRSRLP